MKPVAWSLPEGTERIGYPCGGPGWAFGYAARRPRQWSPATGWIRMKGDRDRGGGAPIAVTDAGVLCSATGDLVGFWSRAAADFLFWQRRPAGALQLVDDDLIFSAAPSPTLYGLTANGLWKVFEADPLPDRTGPILGAARLPEGGVRIAAGGQVFHIGEGGGRPQAVAPLHGDAAGEARKALFARGRVLVASTDRGPLVVHLDLGTGDATYGRFPVRPPLLLDRLWRYAAAGDRAAVTRLLAALDRVPELASPWDLADVVLDGDAVVGLVGERGAAPLSVGGTAPAPGPRPVLEARIDRMSWLLWLEPEACLHTAVDDYLGRNHPQMLPLLEGLRVEAGSRLAGLGLERARGRRPAFDESGGRALFEIGGAEAARLVLAGLDDPDPAVRLLAAQGASAKGLRAALQDGGPRLDRGLRRAFGSGETALRLAALEALRGLRRRGFVERVRRELRASDIAVRSRAAEVAMELPDRTARLLASLRRMSVEDPDPRMREHALGALAAHGSPATELAVVRACADVHPNVRDAAGGRLEALLARMPPARLFDALDFSLLLLMARRKARERGRDWIGEVQIELLPSRVCAALENGPAGRPGRQRRASLLEAAIDLVVREKEHVLRQGRDPRARIVKLLPAVRGPVSTAEPRVLLAVVAKTLRAESPAIADRIGLLSVFATALPEAGAPPAVRSPPRGSLVARLRALAPPLPEDRGLARAQALSASSRLVRLPAAYALAVSDEAERARFEQRCLGPEADRFPILAGCHAARLSADEATAFAVRLALARRVRPHRRLDALEAVREVCALSPTFVPLPVWVALLREVAADSRGSAPLREKALRDLEVLGERATP